MTSTIRLHPWHPAPRWVTLAAFAALMTLPPVSRAETADGWRARLTVAQLKSAYLACDEQSSRTLLDAGSAATCSLIAERLQQQAFDGDFERLIAWWRAAKAERTRLASAQAR